MGWDLRVWHDDLGDRVRLVIEAGGEIPDEIIASLAGSYWLEEVQYVAEDWEEGPAEPGPVDPTPRMHG